jgi:hypothetical protein
LPPANGNETTERKVVGKIIEKVFVWFMILAFYATLAAPHVHATWVALQ